MRRDEMKQIVERMAQLKREILYWRRCADDFHVRGLDAESGRTAVYLLEQRDRCMHELHIRQNELDYLQIVSND
jgi:hypothetical protein